MTSISPHIVEHPPRHALDATKWRVQLRLATLHLFAFKFAPRCFVANKEKVETLARGLGTPLRVTTPRTRRRTLNKNNDDDYGDGDGVPVACQVLSAVWKYEKGIFLREEFLLKWNFCRSVGIKWKLNEFLIFYLNYDFFLLLLFIHF